MEAARIVWDEALTGYDFGPGHPLSPTRLDLTARLARDLGLFRHAGVAVVPVEPAPDELLLTVHTPEYLEAVREASAHPDRAAARFGLGTDDVPAFEGMHGASARIVTATTDLARAVWNGETFHGVNISGGMHHAMPGRASGFCVYNDLAVAIRALLDVGVERIAYVDIDVHHGDGVERAFWNDPRVLTISLHETGRVLFPGTGYPQDIGGPEAEGSAVNVAFPPGTGDAAWLRAFDAVVPSLLRSFRPQILFTQHGCDTHVEDPLAHLADRLPPPGSTPRTQQAWAARYLPLLLAKPYVQGIFWNQLRDTQPHDFPHGGLFDLRRHPKPALRTLASIRQAHLK